MTILLLLAVLVVLNVILLVLVVVQRRPTDLWPEMSARLDATEQAMAQKFAGATTEMAARLEQTKGDLRQQLTDRVAAGFGEIRTTVDQQLAAGRGEQGARLTEFSRELETKFESLRSSTETRLEGFARGQHEALAQNRQELSAAMAQGSTQMGAQIEAFNQATGQALEAMRLQVEQKLGAISTEVQQKLDTNIREGFQHFVKVQEHLKAAEEQLRQVGALGASINDLNSLLKLPHLRGRFGEASLERLITDFLPVNMYQFQAPLPGGRVDVLIKFPDRGLPVDAKFPREQVLALFEPSDEAAIAGAREQLVRVMKVEARRVAAYIQPEHGTMDVALMYLPSETLYFETICSEEATKALADLKIFPVSPNTLLMTLKTISLAYKWYEFAAKFDEARKEIGKAQISLGHFQNQFDVIGKSLDKAQSAYDTAAKHLKSYKKRVTQISGEQVPDGDEPLALLPE